MDYYIARTVTAGFDDTLTRTVAALKNEGFGVLTENRRGRDSAGEA
jgi:hypothetical protein